MVLHGTECDGCTRSCKSAAKAASEPQASRKRAASAARERRESGKGAASERQEGGNSAARERQEGGNSAARERQERDKMTKLPVTLNSNRTWALRSWTRAFCLHVTNRPRGSKIR